MWLWNGVPFTSDMIDDYYGFCYCITNLKSGRKYIGRKVFWFHRKPKGKTRRKTKESDWARYWSSCDELKAEVKSLGEENFKREILSLHKTKGRLNYNETKLLFCKEVIEGHTLAGGIPAFYNNQIGGKWTKRNLM